MKLLMLVVLLLAFPLAVQSAEGFAQKRQSFCEKEFEFFAAELTKLQPMYPVLATLTNAWQIHRAGGDDFVYRLEFFVNTAGPNFSRLANDKTKPRKIPYIRLGFELRHPRSEDWPARSSPINVESLESAYEDQPKNERSHGWCVSRSWIMTRTRIESDDKALAKEIEDLFRVVMDDIIRWQNRELPKKPISKLLEKLGVRCDLEISRTPDGGGAGVLITIHNLSPEKAFTFLLGEDLLQTFHITVLDEKMESISKLPPNTQAGIENPRLVRIEKNSSQKWLIPFSKCVAKNAFEKTERISSLVFVDVSVGGERARFPCLRVMLTPESIKEMGKING